MTQRLRAGRDPTGRDPTARDPTARDPTGARPEPPALRQRPARRLRPPRTRGPGRAAEAPGLGPRCCSKSPSRHPETPGGFPAPSAPSAGVPRPLSGLCEVSAKPAPRGRGRSAQPRPPSQAVQAAQLRGLPVPWFGLSKTKNVNGISRAVDNRKTGQVTTHRTLRMICRWGRAEDGSPTGTFGPRGHWLSDMQLAVQETVRTILHFLLCSPALGNDNKQMFP